jgi:hypothetical protein
MTTGGAFRPCGLARDVTSIRSVKYHVKFPPPYHLNPPLGYSSVCWGARGGRIPLATRRVSQQRAGFAVGGQRIKLHAATVGANLDLSEGSFYPDTRNTRRRRTHLGLIAAI